MGNGDGVTPAPLCLGLEKPTSEPIAALDLKRYVAPLNHYQARGLIGAPNRLYSVPIDASEPVELLILRRGGCVNQSTIE